ncbi:unnamed protein product [Rotaria sordida]|uniref:DH domain-containing protein n=1 Tax=Rotaria sordida TaxID=392033 RepID=A0A819Q426_9BILA|nr:unnamed protein product [Rotaria sordida]
MESQSHSSSHLPFSITNKNILQERSTPVVKEKQISFEVNTNSYNRKVQVKTKQEETKCTTKKLPSPISPPIVTRIIKTETPISLSCVSVNQRRRSSISNSSIQSVRVSVSSSPHRKELEIELNRRHALNQSSTIPSPPPPFNNNDQSIKTRTLSPSPTDIRLPKPLSPFRPVILHRKYQEPIGRFEFVDGSEDSISSFSRRNSRVSVIRSHTFNNPNNANSNLMKISSDEIKSNENVTCQSTPELSCSNERERERNQSVVNMEEACGLSANGTIRTNGMSNVIHLMSDQKTSHSHPIIRSSTPIPNDQSLISKLTFYAVRRHHSAPQQDCRWQQAKRKAIAMQMYDTEKSYVEALKNLVTKYYLPMKDKAVISNDLVNEIFYKIPEIHIHHTAFLISLSQKLSQWDNKQTVADLLLQMFTRTLVIETYTSFVKNYKTGQIAIRLCRDSSSFNKFLQHQVRNHRGKLTLRDLIIQPVQRIPRYELYIKDFLKCTNLNHPAEQIDQVQKDVGSTELTVTNNSLEAVQDIIENLTDLVSADRYYIRHDVVTLQSPSGLKKDRYIFLLNDLLIITTSKRRSGTLTKTATTSVTVYVYFSCFYLRNSSSGKQYIDNAKHKLIMKISLESIYLAAVQLSKTNKTLLDMEI